MVETSGTAPESVSPIPQRVYRHSWKTSNSHYSMILVDIYLIFKTQNRPPYPHLRIWSF